MVEAVESMVAGESIAVMVDEVTEGAVKQLFTDSSSAVAILSTEGGSWRTRHLRLRAAAARQKIQEGEWGINHQGGEVMIADLGTKALTAARFQELKTLLGMGTPRGEEEQEKEGKEEEEVQEEDKEKEMKVDPTQAAQMMRVLVATMMVRVATAQGEEHEEDEPHEMYQALMVIVVISVMGTLFAQWLWTAGVARWFEVRQRPITDPEPRSPTAPEEQPMATPTTERRGSEAEENRNPYRRYRSVRPFEVEIEEEVRGDPIGAYTTRSETVVC